MDMDQEERDVLRKSLGEDGMRVFTAIEATLSEGNEAVKNAASVGAAILASHAKAWSEAETAAGRKQNAEDYLETVNVVANKTAGDVELEDLEKVVRRWHRTIDEYAAADKKEWKAHRNGDLFHVMKIPLVLQTLGAPLEDLYVFGSFFAHSLEHRGMSLDLLRQLPETLVDPLMLIRGNKPNSYVFAIELVDRNGASIVSVIEFEKSYNPSKAKANIINTAFGKTNSSIDDTPSMRWFQRRIEAGDVLYLNKKKSVKWFRTHENSSLASSETLNALSTLILSEDMKKVKTEEDLERIKKEYPTRYQLEYHSPEEGKKWFEGRTEFLASGKRIMNLFEGADETTFLHETAHILYDDLRRASALDETAKKDLKVVEEWAEWRPGQAEEYGETAWGKEFFERDEAIRAAIKSGDAVLERELRAEWREERFARGFEGYMEKGKAPTSALQGVFDRAKCIFRNAYATFRGKGGRPSPAVEKVMARMVSTSSERKKERKTEMKNEQMVASCYEELQDVLDAAGTSLPEAANRRLQSAAETLRDAMEALERTEQEYCGPDQEAWDRFASLQEENIRNILAAADIADAAGKESEAVEKAVEESIAGLERGTAYLRESTERIEQREDQLDEQLEFLEQSKAAIEESAAYQIGVKEQFSSTVSAMNRFLDEVRANRKQSARVRREVASACLKAGREGVKELYYAFKFLPVKVEKSIIEKNDDAVNRSLMQAQFLFEKGAEKLRRESAAAIDAARSHQLAEDFYREAWKDECQKAGGTPTIEVDRCVARRMAAAGMGEYTIRETLSCHSPFQKELARDGQAEKIAREAKKEMAGRESGVREEAVSR